MSDHDVRLSSGTIRYRDTGSGPVLVFVHGLLVSGSLWGELTPLLADAFRCIVPDWPLGSHSLPMDPDADLTPGAVADLIAEFLAALDLREVTLVGNDSGGALCQLVVTRHPERVARLVLTTCDAFEIFPPPLFSYLKVVARVPGLTALLSASMAAFPSLRRTPIAYGRLTKRRLQDATLDAWTDPSRKVKGVRRDTIKFIRGMSSRWTKEAGEALRHFEKPSLVVWTPEDTSFPLSLGKRLAAALPNATLVEIPDAFVFVALDQPAALASHLRAFAG